MREHSSLLACIILFVAPEHDVTPFLDTARQFVAGNHVHDELIFFVLTVRVMRLGIGTIPVVIALVDLRLAAHLKDIRGFRPIRVDDNFNCAGANTSRLARFAGFRRDKSVDVDTDLLFRFQQLLAVTRGERLLIVAHLAQNRHDVFDKRPVFLIVRRLQNGFANILIETRLEVLFDAVELAQRIRIVFAQTLTVFRRQIAARALLFDDGIQTLVQIALVAGHVIIEFEKRNQRQIFCGGDRFRNASEGVLAIGI